LLVIKTILKTLTPKPARQVCNKGSQKRKHKMKADDLKVQAQHDTIGLRAINIDHECLLTEHT